LKRLIKYKSNKNTFALILIIFLSITINLTQAQNWQDLSIREKVGQTVILRSIDIVIKYANNDYENFFKKYPIGGIFDGGEVIEDTGQVATSVVERIKTFQKYSKIPLIVSGDMEAGAGQNVDGLTRLPRLLALGAAKDPALAYDFAKATAIEARTVGFNWLFTPVADLIQNPFNTLVDIRSISDDPELAISLLPSLVKGYQDNNIAATAKHFPGDGVDYINQHLTTSYNWLTIDSWKNNHGKVFKKLIESGVKAIMTGHIGFPDYQSANEFVKGKYLPATLSKELTTNLLKNELGFKGVVVTDALVMGGFTKIMNRTDAEVKSLEIGSDMLLWPTLEYFDKAVAAFESGRIPIERLNDAVERIFNLKKDLGIFDEGYQQFREISDSEKAFVNKTNYSVAEKSITLVRDRNNLLPLKQNNINNALVLVMATSDKVADRFIKKLNKQFQDRNIEATFKKSLWWKQLEEIIADYDILMIAIETPDFQAFHSSNMGILWGANMFGREKTITVSFSNAFHAEEFLDSDVFINVYNNADSSIQAFFKAIFGEIDIAGKSPVNLNTIREFDYSDKAKVKTYEK